VSRSSWLHCKGCFRCRAWLEVELDNLRAALSWSLDAGDSGSALRIKGALWRFWGVRGHFSEGRRWLSTSLSRGEPAPSNLEAPALLALGGLARRQGDYSRVAEDLRASLALYRQELSISERTVENHIGKIFKKLGFASRSQIAAWVAQR
jgi:DNA-binding CsgD family transcriptional regulator